jgi:hypothetical protein
MNIAIKPPSALTSLSLTEAADAVAKGETSAVELTKAALDAIAAGDERVNSFIWLDGEAALETAAKLDKVPKAERGKLHGVPLAHKDMYYKAGKLSTCGSKIRADFRPGYTATVIERLEAEGSFALGGLNMPSSRRTRPATTSITVTATILGGWITAPAARRRALARRSRRASSMRRSVQIPAARSACRPRFAASPGSRARRRGSRAMA